MRIVYFTHSLVSCWNHGNAHFQRGLLRELASRGHTTVACEPANGWSRTNLIADHGDVALNACTAHSPHLQSHLYENHADLEQMLQDADLVIVHEWIDPALAARIGTKRKRGGRFVLLFHDTHHRAVSDPDSMRSFDLSGYDGVMAFGTSLADVYRRAGWGARAFVLHEAADVRLFKPPAQSPTFRQGVVWVGNWGDEERSEEIVEYLLKPACSAGQRIDVHGVRYPASARRTLADYGAAYHGWIANVDVPYAFARHQMTVHVPRRLYSSALPGIPTIRVFEALACGIPLLCAPWTDSEDLFRPGADYLVVKNEAEMQAAMKAVANDEALRQSLAQSGLATILGRHTCAHRADQLLTIVAALQPQPAEAA